MKRVLTWLTPSSDQLHLGNYFGALKPMVELQEQRKDEAEFFLFLSDMHALTKDTFDPAAIERNSLNLLKLYIASGCTPDKFFIYKQSDVPAHAQLTRVFMCLTHMGFMERMHAYKDAVAKGTAGQISVWTFAYPILMAMDIILYDTQFVPVWKDQKQHVEYARDIAEKFNARFGETFELPEPYIQEEVATIPGIDGRKMSKSYNNYIGLLESPEVITKKVMQIPTAALPVEASKNPDEDNVYQIYKLFLTPEEDVTLRARYLEGWLSYKQVKQELAERVIAFTQPLQERYYAISDDMIRALLAQNAVRANELGQKKVTEVYRKVGFLQ